jgi:hypothetical protein
MHLHLTRGRVGAIFLMSLAAGAAIQSCSDSAGPSRPAVPSFQEAACSEWHCESGICGNDTAIYGACCTQAADETHSATSRPSCGSTYCQLYPSRCVNGPPSPADTVPHYCYHDAPGEVCTDTSYTNHNSACNPQFAVWGDFALCQPGPL